MKMTYSQVNYDMYRYAEDVPEADCTGWRTNSFQVNCLNSLFALVLNDQTLRNDILKLPAAMSFTSLPNERDVLAE